MRIKVLRNLGRDLPQYHEGQVIDVSDQEAERLISRGLAEPAGEPIGKTIKAVPPAPAIAEAKAEPGSVERATEDLKEFKDRHTKRQSPSAEPATPETISDNPLAPAK